MKKRILLTVEIESNEPCSDEELAQEIVDVINGTGRHGEWPFEARIRSSVAVHADGEETL